MSHFGIYAVFAILCNFYATLYNFMQFYVIKGYIFSGIALWYFNNVACYVIACDF